MITQEKIDRINELAHKARTDEGLTEEEKVEQSLLRREYIDSFKENLRAQLEMIRPQGGKISDGVLGIAEEAIAETEKALGSIELESDDSGWIECSKKDTFKS